MSKTRFTQWIVLACMGAVAACTSGEGGTVGNTEVNVIVPNGAPSLGGGSSAPGLIDIQSVEYTINCLGNSDTFLENNASFPDEVRLEGNLEVVDGQTSPQGPIPPEFGTPRPGDGAEVWQAFMDLPPGPCTIQLRARDNDGEVICTATEPFDITADTLAKVNLVLVCDVSYQAPVGMLDVDATFSFVVGNFCPDLFVLNCLDSNPQEQIISTILPPFAVTTCEVRFRDGDSTCGAGCDPQTCVVTPEGIDCTPGPDPGVSTTVSCVDGQIDCDFNSLTTETSCTFAGDTLGATPVGGPIVPNAPGAGAFAVACIPPLLGGTPGATVVCTAVTTDGDEDCNKQKVVSVNCPGLTPCQQLDADNGGTGTQGGADAYCDGADGTVCISSTCDDGLAIANSCGGAGSTTCCTGAPVPDGADCSAEVPPLASCQGGVCTLDACLVDADCDSGAECTSIFPGICNVGTGVCAPEANDPAGSSCDDGLGPLSGACDGGGTCVDICSFNAPCPDDANVCTVPSCDPVDGTCSLVPGNEGGTCDFTGPGSADGSCIAGTCVFTPDTCNFAQTGSDLTSQVGIVGVACTNSVTAAQSPFPFTLEVDVPEPVISGAPFNASFDGIGVFPEFFLDAAQGVVPGGVSTAELVDIVATVQVRSGATGADVPLGADTSSLTPGAVLTCDIPAGQVCLVDLDCAGGFGNCNIPVVLAELPTSTDCGVAGTCDLLGKTGAGSQCALNGFCITGDLIIEFLDSGPQPFTATGASGGSVLFGWSDGVGAGTTPVPGLVLCPASAPNCTDPFMPDGCYDLPAAVFSDPTAPIGIRVNASGLFVPIQCAQAEPGGICASGEGCLVDADCGLAPCVITTDVACPTPDAALITCPIN